MTARDARPYVDESEELIAEGDEVETVLVIDDDAARMCPMSSGTSTTRGSHDSEEQPVRSISTMGLVIAAASYVPQ